MAKSLEEQLKELQKELADLKHIGNNNNKSAKSSLSTATYLNWDAFDLKLSKENRLDGRGNWAMWKTTFWVALSAIGYTGGDSDRFTSVDEARMATNVITNVKEGPMALQFLQWNAKKNSALDHVVEFQRLVRRTGEVTLPTTEAQQIIMFINSLRDNKDTEA
ncbi:hypothetical protein DL771_001234 [Monosporascus sp. 5C6A]|nr:hypothetical protein DL771_001234 [Monosporascus sp. 5C6A]